MTNLIERFVDFATNKVVADVDNTNTDTANLGNNGSSVAVDDDLDLQSSQSVTNASSVSTEQAMFARGYTVVEDDNSPLTISNSDTGTYSLANSYDIIKIAVVGGSGSAAIDMQINGDTGANYNHVDTGGSLATGASKWPRVGTADRLNGQVLELTGSPTNRASINTSPHDVVADTVIGDNSNVASDITQFSFFNASNNTFDLTARVLGVTG